MMEVLISMPSRDKNPSFLMKQIANGMNRGSHTSESQEKLQKLNN